MVEGETRGVPVSQAAVQLGISLAAVRKRLQRGQLEAYKLDGEWRIVLPQVEPVSQDQSYASPTTSLVEQLRSENAYLRDRLVEAERAQAELRALLNTEQQRSGGLLDVPATPSEPPTSAPVVTEMAPTSARRWWVFWRRA